MEENKKGEKSVEKRTHDRNVSVIKDADGNNIVMINDIRFKGKRNIDWDEVEQYLKQYVGEFIEIAGSKEIIYIFLGGGTGSALRYCIQLLMHERIVPYNFPWATFTVNIFGSFPNGSTFLSKFAFF